MSTTFAPSTHTSSSDAARPAQLPSPAYVRPLLRALAVFVALDGVGSGIALVGGAVIVFNVLVFALFTVLWIAFTAALVFSSRTLDDLWRAVRAYPLVIQGVVWLLFLPIT